MGCQCINVKSSLPHNPGVLQGILFFLIVHNSYGTYVWGYGYNRSKRDFCMQKPNLSAPYVERSLSSLEGHVSSKKWKFGDISNGGCECVYWDLDNWAHLMETPPFGGFVICVLSLWWIYSNIPHKQKLQLYSLH